MTRKRRAIVLLAIGCCGCRDLHVHIHLPPRQEPAPTPAPLPSGEQPSTEAELWQEILK